MPNVKFSMSFMIDRIRAKQAEIHKWLESYEGSLDLPIYSSVDIRDAGFKIAVVDTNLFPAGFNNLCPHGMEDGVKLIREAILRRVSGCRNILIIAEEHTRNTWYLENIRVLEEMIRKAGFQVKTATFLEVQPSFCEKTRFVELETATGQAVRIYCFKKILEDYEAGRENFCLIILNNDLTTGIPETLTKAKVPIYPSIAAGWHSRLKSHHFQHTADLMKEFGQVIDVDPWLFSSSFEAIEHVDINSEPDRIRLKERCDALLEKITAKYQEHNIKEKPYLVLKSDSGTYGMGVMAIEDTAEILHLNRKKRNALHVGKSSQVISRYLIQEGIPTIHNVENRVSEVVIYQIENNLVGGFYRTHAAKSERENLNAKGASFKTICPHSEKYGDCGIRPNINVFDVYRILARIAGVAAHREIIQLEGAAAS